MSANSKIEWTDHTFNPWIGCAKVSPGCANCYAEKSTRARVLRAAGQETWGKGAQRSKTQTWRDPLKWNRDAADNWHRCECGWKGAATWEGNRCGRCFHDFGSSRFERPRVFCASLADWLDDEVPIEWLADLMTLIGKTPNLDWLLLTKRPESWMGRTLKALNWMLAHVFDLDLANSVIKLDPNFAHCSAVLEKSWDERQAYVSANHQGMALLASWHGDIAGEPVSVPENVWIGTTVENQEMADRRIPILLEIPAKVRFLSCEPLLGPVDLRSVVDWWNTDEKIHWVICGGESGPHARPMHPDWARSLRDQCQAAGVPFLFKQWGEWCPATEEFGVTGSVMPSTGRMPCGKPAQWIGWDGNTSCPSANGLIGPIMAIARMGKKAAGRLLDGREWNEFPTGKGEA